jgi:hypothetical protein
MLNSVLYKQYWREPTPPKIYIPGICNKIGFPEWPIAQYEFEQICEFETEFEQNLVQ